MIESQIYLSESFAIELPKPKATYFFLRTCHIPLFPFMSVTVHAKNQSTISKILGDIILQRIMRSDLPRGFRPKTREPDFS